MARSVRRASPSCKTTTRRSTEHKNILPLVHSHSPTHPRSSLPTQTVAEIVEKEEQEDDEEEERQLSLIEQLLPNEMLLMVFSKLPIHALGSASIVCRQWQAVASSPSLWRTACLDAFRYAPADTNERILHKFHRGSWRDMYMDRCHLRFDGLYVARNTYIRTGATEWKVRNPVHLVAYYRYCRFFPDGTFVYRTTPETVSKVAKSLLLYDGRARTTRNAHVKHEQAVNCGRYKLSERGDVLHTAMRYDNSTSTEVRTKMKVRSTVRGAFNRLDIESIVSYDREDGTSVPMMAVGGEGELGGDGVEERRYNRGLASYVFIPWEQVNSHVLNLPVEKMDVWLPG